MNSTPESTHIYQIFVRNFSPAGNFTATEALLAELDDLFIDWIYLTPIHPIGQLDRKGSLGSPYAIQDYRAINPELGDNQAFKSFVAAVKARGWKLMIDVVFNHSAPDSILAKQHPEWFLHDIDGRLTRKCSDWSDVVDFDFRVSSQLTDELIDTLNYWRNCGVDGFRCDVASLVPVAFWCSARERLNDPKRPLLWLAETVHPSFLRSLRQSGYGGWSEPELHTAFDLSYDYDGWEQLEQVWSGQRPLKDYLDYIDIQENLYPATARKLRFLENHDQIRAVERFGRGPRLEAWTLFCHFLPGVVLSYMGQELALERTPSLFERDPLDRTTGDQVFREFFKTSLAETRKAKLETIEFSWTVLAEGIVKLNRRTKNDTWTALCNLDGRSGYLDLTSPVTGQELFSGREINLAGRIPLWPGALLVRQAL